MRTLPSLLLLLLISGGCSGQQPPLLSATELEWLGQRIYQNECNQQKQCLTSWNTAEDFPSLGIGHFIWYKQGQNSPFEETFPALIKYMQEQQIVIPEWIIAENVQAPWTDRTSFINELNEPRLTELREFLLAQQSTQAAFIVKRFLDSKNLVADSSKKITPAVMEARILAVASVSPPQGLFALIDYVHFKGTGLTESERYNDQGWGLVQVLENMSDAETNTQANNQTTLNSFVASARIILENRVNNAPAERDEQRWLKGWHNRLDGYLVQPVLIEPALP